MHLQLSIINMINRKYINKTIQISKMISYLQSKTYIYFIRFIQLAHFFNSLLIFPLLYQYFNCFINIFLQFFHMHQFEESNKCQLVRKTCQFVVSRAKYVKIRQENFYKIAPLYGYKRFNDFQHNHLQEDDQIFLRFIFIVMSCNYCFWPLQGFQAGNLSAHIKKYIESSVSLQTLCHLSEQDLIRQMFSGVNIPLASQRARMVRQICNVVRHKFQGSFVNVVEKSNKSAVQFLNILTSYFPSFQDHQIYEGHQIHFYKRAQLLIGSIYGKYQGKHLGQFVDIDQLTMFADYRVPQILNEYQIIEYTPQLTKRINNHEQIISGSKQEVEIRASVVIATQKLKQYLNEKQNKNCISYQVDQFLWQLGQSMLGKIVPHHRTLTMYY